MPDDYPTLKRLDHSCLWHPFTQMQDWLGEEPCIISGAEGNFLIDVHGRKYLDGVSSLWCNVHGHRKQELDDAIRSQLERFRNVPLLMRRHYSNPQAGRSRRHCGRANSLNEHAVLQKSLRKLHTALGIADDDWQDRALKIV